VVLPTTFIVRGSGEIRYRPVGPDTAAAEPGPATRRFRLGRLFAADGRTVIFPVDHGTMLGRRDR
jgi:hypothetical protein